MLVFKIHCSLTCFVNNQIKRDAIIKKKRLYSSVTFVGYGNVIKIQNEVKRCFVWQGQGLRSVSAKIIEGLWYSYIHTVLYLYICWYKSTCPFVHFGERMGCGRWLCTEFKVNIWGGGFYYIMQNEFFDGIMMLICN